jgi:hypothetical protein
MICEFALNSVAPGLSVDSRLAHGLVAISWLIVVPKQRKAGFGNDDTCSCSPFVVTFVARRVCSELSPFECLEIWHSEGWIDSGLPRHFSALLTSR